MALKKARLSAKQVYFGLCSLLSKYENKFQTSSESFSPDQDNEFEIAYYHLAQDEQKVYIVASPCTDAVGNEKIKSGNLSVETLMKEIAKEEMLQKALTTGKSVTITIPFAQSRPYPWPFSFRKREHWTNIEVEIGADKSIKITNVDSKGFITANIYPMRHVFKGIANKLNEIQGLEDAKVTTRTQSLGVQGVLDNHNCGRYVLCNMSSIVDPEQKVITKGSAQTNFDKIDTAVEEAGKKMGEKLEKVQEYNFHAGKIIKFVRINAKETKEMDLSKTSHVEGLENSERKSHNPTLKRPPISITR